MKYLSVLIVSGLVALSSCTKDQSDNSQTIITVDSSDVSGRLYVDAFDVNGNKMTNVTASLYLTYDDMQRNISLYTLSSKNSGRIYFGYLLQGNYYVTGTNGTLHDTTVAQILPKRVITRKLFLR